jgi:hypothetical protein
LEKVFVIYDPLYEKVLGVRKTEEDAQKLCEELNENDINGNRCQDGTNYYYWITYDEFELK